MISRIRLKEPIWAIDPDRVHKLLQDVERMMGGVWMTDGISIDKGWRIYSFIRFEYCVQDHSRA